MVVYKWIMVLNAIYLGLSAAEKEWDCEFLKKLGAINVNLTDYLRTQNGPPIAEEIRVVTTEKKKPVESNI